MKSLIGKVSFVGWNFLYFFDEVNFHACIMHSFRKKKLGDISETIIPTLSRLEVNESTVLII